MSTILNPLFPVIFLTLSVCLSSCTTETEKQIPHTQNIPAPQYSLTQDQTHNKFSRLIPPVIKVPSGAVIEAFTEEGSDKQFSINTTNEKALNMFRNKEFNFNLIHPLTGPVYVEGAQPGDILEVILHKIEIGDWGWTVIGRQGFLGDVFGRRLFRTYDLGKDKKSFKFSEKINIPLRPFPGVMGVAPNTDEMVSTRAPWAHGGNMDNPDIIEGTRVYFPVFVEGALFSIGDTHATQGHGEVCGTAMETPMRIVYEVNVIKGNRKIQEPQYETDDYYAVTAFGKTLDEAAKKATRYMVDYLVAEHNLEPLKAYMLCSLAADLKIAEVVNPNMLVTMHISKDVLGI
jgi:acetamidase/formamidase